MGKQIVVAESSWVDEDHEYRVSFLASGEYTLEVRGPKGWKTEAVGGRLDQVLLGRIIWLSSVTPPTSPEIDRLAERILMKMLDGSGKKRVGVEVESARLARKMAFEVLGLEEAQLAKKVLKEKED